MKRVNDLKAIKREREMKAKLEVNALVNVEKRRMMEK